MLAAGARAFGKNALKSPCPINPMPPRLSDQILQYLTDRLQDEDVRRHIRTGLLQPLNDEIRDGNLDASIALALARVTTPIIALVVVAQLAVFGRMCAARRAAT